MNYPYTTNIPDNLVDALKHTFHNSTGHISETMDKRTDIEQYKSVRDVVEYLGYDPDDIYGDNFYKHPHPYFPHSDAPEEDPEYYLHIVVPIEKPYDEDQYFVVFDQMSKIGRATYIGFTTYELNFEVNKTIRGEIPTDFITDFANNGIDTKFHETYLPYPLEWYNGLSGNAVAWKPGSVIIFPSNRIHCTGKMPENVEKMGVSIRLKMDKPVYNP